MASHPSWPFLLAVLLVDLPVLLGVMLVAGKKQNGRYSLYGVVLYREEVSWKPFALVFVSAFVAVYVLMMAVTPLTTRMPRWPRQAACRRAHDQNASFAPMRG